MSEHTSFVKTVKNILIYGDVYTRLGMILLGSGNLARKQILKGLLFLLTEIAYFIFMIRYGITNLTHFLRLGGEPQSEVWNEAKGIYEYTAGDNSLLFLLYGVITVCITLLFLAVWKLSLQSGYAAQCRQAQGKPPESFRRELKELFNKNLHITLLSLPITGVLCFTILPLIFMICMAFTNYSREGDHLLLFHWAGLSNFTKVLAIGDSIGRTFRQVLGWTLVWAFFATFLNYVLGMVLAIVINREATRWKGFWRFCFILSAAIPQFVSLLIMRTLLQSNGLVNVLLQQAGWISAPLPFLADATWARVTVIMVNLWIGIPFTMMQVTGILTNIPGELYEAARIDGAGRMTTFFKITLPYMLFVTTPYLITAFTGNVNNFNVIYLLTAGNPVPVGDTAGKTDLLVTWLYKLTIEQGYYNLGAVIGIMTFAVLAVISLLTYHRSGSYRNEEGFQ